MKYQKLLRSARQAARKRGVSLQEGFALVMPKKYAGKHSGQRAVTEPMLSGKFNRVVSKFTGKSF